MKQNALQQVSRLLLILLSGLFANAATGHGGVSADGVLCVINIDFWQSYFTVFQPETSDSQEYCEDIPAVARWVFVMEYLHTFLKEMAVDFRIIRDVNDVGQYAKWEDIAAIEDLEAATVYYESPRVEPGGYYRASYAFDTKGTYIGIVTAEHPSEDRVYNAVFYFQVGGAEWGTIPIFIALLVLLQLGYWLSNGGFTKIKLRIAANRRSF